MHPWRNIMDELQRILMNAGLISSTRTEQSKPVTKPLSQPESKPLPKTSPTGKQNLNESTEQVDEMGNGGMGFDDDPMQGQGEREGLEGPFNFDGRILYYDPIEGAYYDPSTDFYLDDEEAMRVQSRRQFEDTVTAFENFIREMGMEEDFGGAKRQQPSFGKRKPAGDIKQHPSYGEALNSATQLLAQNPDPDLASEITAKEYAGEMGVDPAALKVAIVGDLKGANTNRLATRFD